jgi:hypothetical protein
MTNDPWGLQQTSAASGFDGTANPWSGANEPRLKVSSRPPVLWLLASLLASLAALALAGLLGDQLLFAGIAWLLSGPVALLLVAVFTWRETERLSRATAIVQSWIAPARLGALVLALLAIVASALRIAYWTGRNLDLFG